MTAWWFSVLAKTTLDPLGLLSCGPWGFFYSIRLYTINANTKQRQLRCYSCNDSHISMTEPWESSRMAINNGGPLKNPGRTTSHSNHVSLKALTKWAATIRLSLAKIRGTSSKFLIVLIFSFMPGILRLMSSVVSRWGKVSELMQTAFQVQGRRLTSFWRRLRDLLRPRF